MSRETLRQGCCDAERNDFTRGNTLRRLLKARVPRPPVLIANYIYASRVAARNSLIPLEPAVHSFQGELAAEQDAEPPRGYQFDRAAVMQLIMSASDTLGDT